MTAIHTSTSSTESRLREEIAEIGRSFRNLGMAPGTPGNISAKLDDGWLMTPTNASLGALDPAEISKLDWDGNLLAGKPPTKESFLHRAFYEQRPDTGGIIHLHATHSAAVAAHVRRARLTALFRMVVSVWVATWRACVASTQEWRHAARARCRQWLMT